MSVQTIGKGNTEIKNLYLTADGYRSEKETPLETEVIYRGTTVVRFNDSAIYLNTGGYWTATTKRRMNQASNQYNLGFDVYQEKGAWFVTYGDNTFEFQEPMLALRRIK